MVSAFLRLLHFFVRDLAEKLFTSFLSHLFGLKQPNRPVRALTSHPKLNKFVFVLTLSHKEIDQFIKHNISQAYTSQIQIYAIHDLLVLYSFIPGFNVTAIQ